MCSRAQSRYINYDELRLGIVIEVCGLLIHLLRGASSAYPVILAKGSGSKVSIHTLTNDRANGEV